MENQNSKLVEITENEASQLIKILDLAVKQVGILDGGEVANNAIYFANKLNQAFKEKNKEEVLETEKE